ncbi:hypothetical protein I4U23_018694 [Adineta vaga]|nr:hypothetical protein I4U23_018694 [Adineta vaga]
MYSVLLILWFFLLKQSTAFHTRDFRGLAYKEYTNEELSLFAKANTATTLDGNSTQLFDDDDDDVIELNIGGERITTLRSTLTAVPNSKLALMFSKNNTEVHKSKDQFNAVFFDYNPIQFKYLLDQLRTIKRRQDLSPYEIHYDAPLAKIQTNFSDLISDLGLSPEQFLSPLNGVYTNLHIKSLIGWQECYRSKYETPLDLESAWIKCIGRRFLVACNLVNNTETLTLAGVTISQDQSSHCSNSNECTFDIKNGIGFYRHDQAWGFEGRPKNFTSAHYYNNQNSFLSSVRLNPCDSNDQYSEYRLCWSLRSNVHRGGGDRCGKVKNLHNAFDWERIIYRAI